MLAPYISVGGGPDQAFAVNSPVLKWIPWIQTAGQTFAATPNWMKARHPTAEGAGADSGEQAIEIDEAGIPLLKA